MELKFYENKLSCFTSQKLGCTNAFFTRNGGVSCGDTSSLNLAFGRCEDTRENVLRNLSRCADSLSFDAKSVVSCPQIHSCDILSVDSSHKGLGYFKEGDISCDGYVTTEPGVVLGVKTADCVPILMSAKRDGRVFAIAAVHAGWRGSVCGIAKKAVEKLIALGADKSSIFVAIGPCASSCCYEVGEEVYLKACENFGLKRADKYFSPNGKGTKYRADLKGFNASLTSEAGVPYENIDICELCTMCEERLFYSHRRDGERRGTHLNIIFF